MIPKDHGFHLAHHLVGDIWRTFRVSQSLESVIEACVSGLDFRGWVFKDIRAEVGSERTEDDAGIRDSKVDGDGSEVSEYWDKLETDEVADKVLVLAGWGDL